MFTQKPLIVLAAVMISIVSLLSACKPTSSQPQPEVANAIKVGVIEGPETTLMEVAKETAKKKFNLDIKLIVFNDYNVPNMALNENSIDANMFQHQPYLNAAVQARHYDIVSIGKTFIYPMGIYSHKIKKLSDLPDNARVAIPNDPSNEARALLLLQQAKLIELKNNNPLTTTVQDISVNNKKLIFEELDAAQLTRALDDVELAVINTNYAVADGLLPSRDALFIENKDSPYANLVVVRTKDKDDPRFQQLLEALHSPEVSNEASRLFKNQAIPAWK